MSATGVEASVKDPASSANVPIEGIEGASGLSNPSAGISVRQVVALGDGTDGSAQFARVDADRNLRVVAGRSATATATQTSADVTAQHLLSSNAARVGATIWNQSGSALYLGFTSGVTAGPTGNASWVIQPGSVWTMPIAYTGDIYGIWDQAEGQANVAEFT